MTPQKSLGAEPLRLSPPLTITTVAGLLADVFVGSADVPHGPVSMKTSGPGAVELGQFWYQAFSALARVRSCSSAWLDSAGELSVDFTAVGGWIWSLRFSLTQPCGLPVCADGQRTSSEAPFAYVI